MLKQTMLAATCALLITGGAVAQDKAPASPPTNAEQCTKMMDEVLDAFADKQLADDAAS